jgi:hypothetical protein
MATTIENARSKRSYAKGQEILRETDQLLISAYDDIIGGTTDTMTKQMDLYDIRPTNQIGDIIIGLIIDREQLYQEKNRIMDRLDNDKPKDI